MTKKEIIGQLSLLRPYVEEEGIQYLDNIQEWIMSIVEKDSSRDFDKLAEQMIQVYHEAGCKGKYPYAPNTHWTCSVQIISNRLQSPRINLASYSDEQIIEATKKYIDVPIKDYKRTLLYFIWKNDNNELKSDLLTYLDNNDSDDTNGSKVNWLYE